MKPRTGRTIRSLFRLLLAVAVLVVLLFPVYWMVTMSLKPQVEWTPTTGQVQWLPQDWTIGNFTRLFGGGDEKAGFLSSSATRINAMPSILTSLVASVGGTLLALLAGVTTAYGISRYRAGGTALPFQILQLRMFPPIAIIIPILFLWTYLRLFDTILGLILIYGAVTFPFVVWLMRSFFDEIPREIAEAAIVDGCSPFEAFFRAVLPLVRGGLATTALFVFILNWSDFLIALVLTGNDIQTAPVFLSQIRTAAGQDFGTQAALGLILIIPPILISALIQKHLVRGLTFGAVKR